MEKSFSGGFSFRTRLSRQTVLDGMTLFLSDVTASKAVELLKIDRKSVDLMFSRFRQAIYEDCLRRRVRRLRTIGIEDASAPAQARLPESLFSGKVQIFICAFYLDSKTFDPDGEAGSNEILQTELSFSRSKDKHSTTEIYNSAPAAFLQHYGVSSANLYEYPLELPDTGEIKSYLLLRRFPEFVPDFGIFAASRFDKTEVRPTPQNLILYVKENEWRINNRNRNLFDELLKLITL